MNNLSINTIAVVFLVIVLVTVGGFLFAKKNSKSYKVLDTKGKERLFSELVQKLKEEDMEYHMYVNMTQEKFEGKALVMIRDFYTGGEQFREFIPHSSQGGNSKDNQFFDVYERIWEQQLKGLVGFDDAKRFVDEAHQILKWIDTPLSDGSRRFVVDGKDVFPKERLRAIARGEDGSFYKDLAIFKEAMVAYNVFTFEGDNGQISLGRVSIPSKFFTKDSWERIRNFVDKAFMDFFVLQKVTVSHSSIINYINLRLPKQDVVPLWIKWREIEGNGSDFGKTDEEIAKRRKS